MGSLFLFYLVSVVHWFHSSALSGENEDVGRLNPLDPSYIILAPRVIRPGMVYRLSATLLKNEPLQIRASLLRDGVSLDSTHRDCQVGVSELLLMKVPASITGGHFVLRVEGSINGGLGGVAFTNETALMFSNRSLTVFVQMERPVYKQGQTVRFRAIPISTALKPFDDAIDVFMLDPRGQIMKQWLSRQSNYGAVSLSYEIGDQPMFGQWTIRITARGQTTDQAFVIEEYFRTVFELNVTLPALVTHADQYLRGTVTANHTDGAPVRGNLTLKATLRNPSGEVQETLLQFRDMEQYTGLYFLSFLETRDTSLFPFFSGVYSFSYPIDDLLYLMPDMNFIQITATVGDSFWGHVVEARSACKFFNGSLYLRFLNPSPSVFAPEFPITAYISISYYDGSRLPSHALRAHRLRITPRVRLQNGRDELLESRELISISPGLWELQLDFKEELSLRGLSPMNVTCANVDAGYITQYETTAAWATLALVPEYAPAGRHIQLRTSSVRPKVGEYLILHVRTNYYLDSFNYLIISKGVVLSQGKEYMKNMIHSFAFSLGPEMAPELTVLLYHISALGDLVVASLAVPIDGLSKDEFSVQVNVQKDKVLDGVEIIVRGRPGSYVGLSAARSSLTSLLNTMSKAEVTRRLSSFDTVPLVLHQNWLNKEGVVEESLRFPWTTYQRDANKSIQAVGLVVLTDARIQMESRRQCSDSLRSAAPCFGGKGPGKCGRRSLCHTDKKPCELESNNVSPLLDSPEFPVDRFSRASETWFEGSWLWQDLNIGPHGHSIFSISLPKTPTSWAITAISVAEDTGLALLSGPLIFEGVRPFHMKMEAPSVCHQGEQVGLRITLFNAMERDIQATVVLLDSQRHRFVHVEAGGVVASYNPRTSNGNHEHLVWIKKQGVEVVYMPIVPQGLGQVFVTVVSRTNVGKDEVTKVINVLPDGVPQFRHTPVLVDLSNRAYSLQFIKVNVSSSPIVPYQQHRLYVFGSNEAVLSLVGDVVGETLMRNDSDLPSRLAEGGSEQTLFRFAHTLYSIVYLHSTNQDRADVLRLAFHQLNLYYQKQLSFQMENGAFCAYRWRCESDLWLTAFTIQVFQESILGEWENYFFVDISIVEKAVSWLLSKQNRDGSFSPSPGSTSQRYNSSVSLTAQCVISLHHARRLSGDLGSGVATALKKAVQFLDRRISNLRQTGNPLEIAIVSYALLLTQSAASEGAFLLLSQHARRHGEFTYWSPHELQLPSYVVEAQSPHVVPLLPQQSDSLSVEATGYALMVHVARQELFTNTIVRWLTVMRHSQAGWGSTRDSIVAFKALIDYSVQSRLTREITDLTVAVEASPLRGLVKNFFVNRDNMALTQKLGIPNAYGQVKLQGNGAGVALAQLGLRYHVDRDEFLTPSPVPDAFQVETHMTLSGRNSSLMELKSCQRWLRGRQTGISSRVVLELPVPSGYEILESKLRHYIRHSGIENLNHAQVLRGKIAFFFSYLKTDDTCINLSLSRRYPVANMTRYLPVRLYHFDAPEEYVEKIIDAIRLYSLDICQVCGSYQCPYCPIYSSGPLLQTGYISVLVVGAFAFFSRVSFINVM